MSSTQKITKAAIAAAAASIGVPAAAVYAVYLVESNGRGFMDDGRPVILFERHIMRRQLQYAGIPTAQFERTQPDIVNVNSGGYTRTSAGEHARLDRAVQINRVCALESASWGLFQLMGFNHARCGFPAIQAFVNAMYRSEAAQLDAFLTFVKADPAMLAAMRAQDWAEFARLYNGRNYAKNNYDTRLKDAFDQWVAP